MNSTTTISGENQTTPIIPMPSWEEQLRNVNYSGTHTVVTEEGNFKVEFEAADNPQDPITEFDNASNFLFSHRRYNLGDQKLWGKLGISINDFDSWADVMKWLYKNEDICHAFMVNMYDHSGITISISNVYPYNDRWDSGCIGIAYMTKKEVRDNFLVKKITKKIKEQSEILIRAEVQVYDDYLTGNVYGYDIETEGGYPVDSCSGYYGDFDKSGIVDEVISAIASEIKERKALRIASYQRQFAKLKTQMKKKVPMQYRKPFRF